MKTEIKIVKLSQIKLNPDNPRQIAGPDMNKLVKSLQEFPDMMEIREIVVDEDMMILGGNMRYQALKKIKAKKCRAKIVTGLTDKQKREFVIKDNSNFGEYNFDILADGWKDLPLDDWGVDLPEDWFESVGSGEPASTKIEKVETILPDEEIKKRIKETDKIIYQFSGGRDSTLAILKTLEIVRDKNPVACYVDTGTEFPDLLYFIYNFCKKHDLSLEVLRPKKNFFEIYGENKTFPDPVFRDCIQRLINNPIDDVFFSYENALIIRGGRNKQKTSRSKSNIYQEIVKSKNKIRKLLNPLFVLSNEKYNADIKNVKIWDGYNRGFIRTACWCCPFQREPQWEALKENYLLLWQSMFELTKLWKFKEIKGDGCIKQFKKYWDKQ